MSAFIIRARGHPNLLGTHHTTWQLTREPHLTQKGDCIIGVDADAGAVDFPQWLQTHLQAGKKIKIEINSGD